MIATTARKASASLYDMSHIGCHHRKGFRGGSLLPSTQVVSAIPLPAIVAHARREMLPLQLGRDASDDARRRRRAGALSRAWSRPGSRHGRMAGSGGLQPAARGKPRPDRVQALCAAWDWRASCRSGRMRPTAAGSRRRGSSRRTRRARRCAGRARRNGVRSAHGHQMHELGSIE